MSKIAKRVAALLCVVVLLSTMMVVPASAASQRSIGYCKITVDNDVYTGVALKPNTVVKDGSKTLKCGKNYTLVYSNNVNAGTGRVTIKGKGNYTGTVTRYFTIAKRDISQCTIKLGRANWWNSQPAITVKYGNNTISEANYVPVWYIGRYFSFPEVRIYGKNNLKGYADITYFAWPI